MKNATKKTTTFAAAEEVIIFSQHFIAVGTNAPVDEGWDIWSIDELADPLFRETAPRFHVGLQLHLSPLLERLDAIINSRANQNT